jgi:hypothetical protein
MGSVVVGLSLLLPLLSILSVLFGNALLHARAASDICSADSGAAGTVLLVFLPGYQELLSIRKKVS